MTHEPFSLIENSVCANLERRILQRQKLLDYLFLRLLIVYGEKTIEGEIKGLLETSNSKQFQRIKDK